MIRVVCLLIGYVFGLFQTSFLYGKMHGIDIRNYGSGNAGTTNALRVLGTKAGLIVFGGDVIKCILAVLVVRLLFGNSHPDMKYLYMLYAGAGAIQMCIRDSHYIQFIHNCGGDKRKKPLFHIPLFPKGTVRGFGNF